MNEPIQPASNEDLYVWPDGAMCYREEIGQMTHKSDDYEVVPLGTPRWNALMMDEI
jgi:hypothetical protein